MIRFSGRILSLGCGAVSQCAIPLLFDNIHFDPRRMTIMDFVDNRRFVKKYIRKGAKYVRTRVTKRNMAKVLKAYLGRGDLLIDLAWNIGCREILTWCHDNGVLYVNTSVEEWDPYEGIERKTPQERTLYHRQMRLRDMYKRWGGNRGATAVLEHGANPGLVSHFTKAALEDIARRILKEKPKDERRKALERALSEKDFPRLAYLENVKVIHISERDTQITDRPKEVGEFVNTWSVEGFREEGMATAEMGWGTHEKRLPKNAYTHRRGPKNQICLARPGIKTWVRSWVPDYGITGMVVRHGEAFSISDYLTVKKDGKAVYRPTVHYAYCPCDEAINSLHELEMRNYELQPKVRIMTDEITDGADILGVLLMGHDFKSWWTGSLLDIHETRRLVPHQNATTLQVACSALAAVKWMLRNPGEGVRLPDDLPHDEILRDARPYLGPFVSKACDWTPLKNRGDLFGKYDKTPKPKKTDMWQFGTFLVE